MAPSTHLKTIRMFTIPRAQLNDQSCFSSLNTDKDTYEH